MCKIKYDIKRANRHQIGPLRYTIEMILKIIQLCKNNIVNFPYPRDDAKGTCTEI